MDMQGFLPILPNIHVQVEFYKHNIKEMAYTCL